MCIRSMLQSLMAGRGFRLLMSFTAAILAMGLLTACGGGSSGDDGGGSSSDPPLFSLSGTVGGRGVTDHADKPILVALMRHSDAGQISLPDFSQVVAMVSVDKSDFSFRIDLAESGLAPGDAIDIAAFVDVNSSGGVPNPDAGDYVGFHVDGITFQTAYVLQNGRNRGVHVDLNRLVRPFTTTITGTVGRSEPGDLLILAYAGEIDALDFTRLDPDEVVGYLRLPKEAAPLDYAFEVLPYPPGLQTDKVYILALVDDTGAGMPAPGNLIGLHTDPDGTTPELLWIDDGQDSHEDGVDIRMRFPDPSGEGATYVRIPEPSGDSIVLKGNFSLPNDFDPEEGAVFVLVARTDNPSGLITSPLSSVAYFQKMPPGETRFSLDLSQTGLSLSDKVMVLALWDRDHAGGFPDPTAADVIGFLQNKDQLSITVSLSQPLDYTELPAGWDFSVNKTVYDHSASIHFFMDEDGQGAPQPDDTVVAVAFEKQLLDPQNLTIDMDYVVGLAELTVRSDGLGYTMNILPAIYDGIAVATTPFGIGNLYLAILGIDQAGGNPDQGKLLGYYPNPQTPLQWQPFTITDGTNVLAGEVVFFPPAP